MIRDASTRVISELDFFRDPRGATYRDSLNAAADHLKEVDAAIIRLQGKAPVRDPKLIAHGVDYLKASQESLRQARAVMLARVEIQSAYNSARGTTEDLGEFISDPSNEANRFRAKVAGYSASTISKRLTAANDALDVSVAALGKALSSLVEVRNKHPLSIPESAYIPNDKLQNITFKVVE